MCISNFKYLNTIKNHILLIKLKTSILMKLKIYLNSI